MATVGDLVVNLGLNKRGYSRGLQGAQGDTQSFVGGLRSILSPVAKLLGGVAAGLGARASVNAAREQLASERKLAAVLAATGGAAGLTATQIAGYASDLQKLTNYGDETTISAAGMLATFREIRGDVFKGALSAAQDLSATFGTDLKSSIVQVGKALNDPIRGITALSRVGVTFSDAQRSEIKALQEAGNIAGAQAVILSELRNQFGGAAAAMADPITQAFNVLGDVAELIGFVLLPSLNAIASAFTAGAAPITDARQRFQDVGDAIAGVVELTLGPLVSAWETVAGFVIDAAELIAFSLRHASDLASLAMLDLGIAATSWIPGLESGLQDVGAFFVAMFDTAGVASGAFVDNVLNGFQEIKNAGAALVTAIKAAFDALVTGENPLSAFADSFVETLAGQTDAGAFQDVDLEAIFGDTFAAAREGFAADGFSLVDQLKSQRLAIADNIGQAEFDFQIAQAARRAAEPVTGPDIVTPATGGRVAADAKPAQALEVNTAAGFEAAIAALTGTPDDEQAKQTAHLADIADATDEMVLAAQGTQQILSDRLRETETRRLS